MECHSVMRRKIQRAASGDCLKKVDNRFFVLNKQINIHSGYFLKNLYAFRIHKILVLLFVMQKPSTLTSQ